MYVSVVESENLINESVIGKCPKMLKIVKLHIWDRKLNTFKLSTHKFTEEWTPIQVLRFFLFKCAFFQEIFELEQWKKQWWSLTFILVFLETARCFHYCCLVFVCKDCVSIRFNITIMTEYAVHLLLGLYFYIEINNINRRKSFI